jgi:CDP-diacylglycerol--glycerol-3-phosphate 3-phosphatidyltransferase
MISTNFQKNTDNLIKRYLLGFLPKTVTPNHLTILRLLLVPVVYWLLYTGYTLIGFAIFVIAALTDAMDGAMARTQDKITDFGKLMDPIADKLLIGSVFFYIGYEYLIVRIFLGVIAFEILAITVSALAYHKIGRPIGANVYGKIKMVLQTIAIVIFLTGILSDATVLILISEWVLFVALFFALVSGLEQMRRKLER